MLSDQELQDLLHNPAPGAINSDIDVHKRMFAKDALGKRREELKETMKQYGEYFKEELAKIDKQEDFLDTQILSYIENAKGGKAVKLPFLTVSAVHRQSVTWPADDALVQFAEANEIEGGVKTEKKPVKEAIKRWCARYERRPPGLVVEEKVSLGVRKGKVKEEEETADVLSDLL